MNLKKYIFIIIPVLLNITLLNAKQEYIVNGNFESGNTGFYTDYTYSATNLRPEGVYTVAKNPKLVYSRFDSCKDHTSNSGNMLVVNGHKEENKIVWGQTIRNLTKQTDYVLSFWHTSLNIDNPAYLEIYINGVKQEPLPIYLSNETCDWQNTVRVWNSNNVDTAEIRIIDLNLRVTGNDFALDDFSFMERCSLNIIQGKDVTICPGETVKIKTGATGENPPYRYEWSPKYGIDDPNVQEPAVTSDTTISYTVKITDDINCFGYDTIKVNVVPNPKPVIATDKTTPICPCDSITLIAPNGFKYLWSTGSTNQTIIVKEKGTYGLTVENSQGCKGSTKIDIDILDINSTMIINSINVNIGEKFSLPISLISDDSRKKCGFENFNLSLRYDKSVLIPVGNFVNRVIDGNHEVVTIKGNSFESLENDYSFIPVLGKVECTDLKIEKFSWNCDKINISTQDGKICIKNLCTEGGLRLIDSEGKFFLNQNTPNPVSEITTIQYGLLEKAHTKLELINSLGEITDIFINSLQNPGTYEIKLNLTKYPAGVYFYRLQNGSSYLSKKLELVK